MIDIVIGSLFIGNFLLSFIAGGVASAKGRSSIGYFFLSVMFSFLIVILVLAALPIKSERKIYGLRECPYCLEEVKSLATICKHCGKELEPEASAREQANAFRGNGSLPQVKSGTILTIIACLLLFLWFNASSSPDLDPVARPLILCFDLGLLGLGIFQLVRGNRRDRSDKPVETGNDHLEQ